MPMKPGNGEAESADAMLRAFVAFVEAQAKKISPHEALARRYGDDHDAAEILHAVTERNKP